MMKKLISFLLVFVLMTTAAFAATVSRDIPSRVSPGQEITVELQISNIQVSEDVKTFAIEEEVASGFSISDWSISGIEESKDQITTEFSGNAYKWQFTPIGGTATITYTTTAPTEEGSYQFQATWFDQGGMPGEEEGLSTVTVRTITCGDGFCEGTENADNCPADCAVPETTTVTQATTTTTMEEEPGEANYTWLWILIIVLVILAIILLLVKKKQKKTLQG